jgi:predicted phosphodiesterase
MPIIDIIADVLKDKKTMTWDEIGIKYGYNPGSIRNYIARMKRRGEVPEEPSETESGPGLTELTRDVKGEYLYQKYFNLIKNYRDVRGDGLHNESVKRHYLQTDAGWILLTFSADWHLGSFYVNPNDVENVLDFIIENPDVFLITVGDLIDNFRRFRSTEALFGQLPPNDQYKILESIVERLTEKGKLVATTWGNHDVEFDERISGFSYIRQLLTSRTKYFHGMGRLDLRVNEVEYKIGLTHHYKGTSIYNPNHEHIRYIKEQFPDVDIVVMGHRHFPAGNWFPVFQNGGHPIPYMVRCGSPKDDAHAARYYGRAINGNHYFFLSGKKKKLLWVNDVTIDFEDVKSLYYALIKS